MGGQCVPLCTLYNGGQKKGLVPYSMCDRIDLESYWSYYGLTSVCINNTINVPNRVRRINDDIIIRRYRCHLRARQDNLNVQLCARRKPIMRVILSNYFKTAVDS